MTEQLIIFDTEYASWQGVFSHRSRSRKEKGGNCQIAAVKVNLPDLSVAENLNLYIKPHFTPRLTEYFINLTGITDALLEQRRPPLFPKPTGVFKQFAGRLPCYSHGWSLASGSTADGIVIGYNLEMFGISDDSPLDYRNIADWF